MDIIITNQFYARSNFYFNCGKESMIIFSCTVSCIQLFFRFCKGLSSAFILSNKVTVYPDDTFQEWHTLNTSTTGKYVPRDNNDIFEKMKIPPGENIYIQEINFLSDKFPACYLTLPGVYI